MRMINGLRRQIVTKMILIILHPPNLSHSIASSFFPLKDGKLSLSKSKIQRLLLRI